MICSKTEHIMCLSDEWGVSGGGENDGQVTKSEVAVLLGSSNWKVILYFSHDRLIMLVK